MSESQLFNLVIAFFEEDDWDFQWVDDSSMLSMYFSGKNGTWICYAQVRELQQQFVYYSLLPINAPADRRAAVAEFITRANYGMIIGNFEMDFDSGEVRYKTSVDVEDAELTMPMIRHLVYANIVITDHYLPGIMRVIYGNMEPSVVLSLIEQESFQEESRQNLMDLLEEIEDDLLDEDFDEDDDFDDEDFDEDDDFAASDNFDNVLGLDDDFGDDESDMPTSPSDPNPFDDDEPPSTNGKTPH